ncbi:hypothetical protein [Nocardia brasiliensis]|uniref:hypothetical protein n=1 Tax=Nocardia brasiliensis TaxID=37326 RepID=UPI00114CA99B|nr:hypothetical protein [Nocardia brasiliensis]
MPLVRTARIAVLAAACLVAVASATITAAVAAAAPDYKYVCDKVIHGDGEGGYQGAYTGTDCTPENGAPAQGTVKKAKIVDKPNGNTYECEDVRAGVGEDIFGEALGPHEVTSFRCR